LERGGRERLLGQERRAPAERARIGAFQVLLRACGLDERRRARRGGRRTDAVERVRDGSVERRCASGGVALDFVELHRFYLGFRSQRTPDLIGRNQLTETYFRGL